jgi:hypothetical protein
MTQQPIAHSTRKPETIQSQMPNSIEFWSKGTEVLKVVGFCIAGLALIVTVLGWHFSSRAGALKDAAAKMKEAALERFKQESALSIAEADAKAAEANKIAAQANERAALLEKDAANSRLELGRLQQKLAWRVITDEQAEHFKAIVAGAPRGKVSMTYLSNNQEVMNFAYQLAQLLRHAGYDAPEGLDGMTSFMPIGGAMVGV